MTLDEFLKMLEEAASDTSSKFPTDVNDQLIKLQLAAGKLGYQAGYEHGCNDGIAAVTKKTDEAIQAAVKKELDRQVGLANRHGRN